LQVHDSSIQTYLAKALILLGFLASIGNILAAPAALLFGIAIALLIGNPWGDFTKKLAPKTLSYSLVAVGAGMSLFTVAKAGLAGFSYTFVTISCTLGLGLFLMKLYRSDYESSFLVTAGTAICGGSAIAAVSPAIHAKASSMSIALAVVFLLNSVGLLIFPSIGHIIGFSEHEFGLWAALAIHDTSAVIGSTMSYGPKAMEIGVTVKLARALWIVPLTLWASWYHSRKKTNSSERSKFKIPWFILGFLLSAAFFTFATRIYPELDMVRKSVETIGKKGLIATLFLIGLNINLRNIKEVGFKPVLLGLTLWLIVSVFSGLAIYYKLIS